jgi:tetratricopeptide (TPR) repeat protein
LKQSKVPQGSSKGAGVSRRGERRRLLALLFLLLLALGLWAWAPLRRHWLESQALPDLTAYSQAHPADRDAALLLVERYLEANQPAQAEAIATQVIQQDPTDGRGWLLLSRAEFDQGKLREVYASLQVGLPHFDASAKAEAHWRMGLLRVRSDDEQQAELEFRRALEIDPQHPGAHLELARGALSELHYGEALKHLEIVLRREPRNIAALEASALSYRGLGNLEQAERYAREEVRLAPRSAGSWRMLGMVLKERATPAALTEAEQAYRRALQIEPNSSEFHQQLGMIAFSRGNYSQAAAELQRAIDLHPLNRQAYPTLMQCYRRLGQTDRAERLAVEYRKIDEMDLATAPLEYQVWAMPENTGVRMRLANLYLRYHRRDLALAQVEYVLKLNPNHAEAHRLRDKLKKSGQG